MIKKVYNIDMKIKPKVEFLLAVVFGVILTIFILYGMESLLR